MADLWNYLIVEDADPERVARQVLGILEKRGWVATDLHSDGALRFDVWSARDGTVVVELKGWEGADRSLARDLAKLRGAPLAVSFHDGAGETELFLYLTARGSARKAPADTLGGLASPDAWTLVPSSSSQEVAVLAPLEPATRAVLGMLGQTISPLLGALDFRKTRVDVRYHPSIDVALAWSKRVDGGKLLVRYDFGKGEKLTNCTQTILLSKGEENIELAHLACDTSACWRDNPLLIARDFDMFAAQLATVLAQHIEGLSPAEKSTLTDLGNRYAELIAQRRIVRIVEAGDIEAELGFRGERLVTVRAGALRFTFKFDTSLAPDSADLTVGDIVELRGGAIRARRLRIGTETFLFDELGHFLP